VRNKNGAIEVVGRKKILGGFTKTSPKTERKKKQKKKESMTMIAERKSPDGSLFRGVKNLAGARRQRAEEPVHETKMG